MVKSLGCLLIDPIPVSLPLDDYISLITPTVFLLLSATDIYIMVVHCLILFQFLCLWVTISLITPTVFFTIICY